MGERQPGQLLQAERSDTEESGTASAMLYHTATGVLHQRCDRSLFLFGDRKTCVSIRQVTSLWRVRHCRCVAAATLNQSQFYVSFYAMDDGWGRESPMSCQVGLVSLWCEQQWVKKTMAPMH
jgi:hypothetical protein